VNAVLRKVGQLVNQAEPHRERSMDRRDELPLSDGSAVALREAILPEDTLERLSVTTSHPVSLLQQWSDTFSLDRVMAIAMHSLCRPPVILNTSCINGPIPEGAVPHTLPGHHVFEGDISSLRELLASRSDIWVQDPASSLAAESVVDLEPSLVMDVCAGKGTKTRQLAQQLVINPNTVVRTYRELETEGLVYKKRGAGTFVSAEVTPYTEEVCREILGKRLDVLIVEGINMGFFKRIDAVTLGKEPENIFGKLVKSSDVNASVVSPDDFSRHIYAVGATGTGKTSLIRLISKHLEMLNLNGKFPNKNTKLKFKHLLFTVEVVDKKRIKQIKVNINPDNV